VNRIDRRIKILEIMARLLPTPAKRLCRGVHNQMQAVDNREFSRAFAPALQGSVDARMLSEALT
jgi:hypothetical protein